VTERRHFFHLTKKELYIIGGAYLGFIFLAVVGMAVGSRYGARPKDAALVQQFYEHRHTLEQIKRMLEKDAHLGVIAEYGVRPKNFPLGSSPPEEFGVSRERFDRYLNLLKTAGVLTVVRDDEFRFFVAASGFASKGYRIAIVFRKTVPKELISNLDSFHKTTSEWEVAYRPIIDNWYLYIIW
jgi:hypothetical protein